MIPADFPEANFTFQKPQDMTDEECTPLRVQRGYLNPEGFPASISKWVPTPEEREILKNLADDGAVYLTIVGRGHPPVIVSLVKPEMVPE